MESDIEVRPGFNLEASFKGHLGIVRGVLHNPNTNLFVSFDDRSLKSWCIDRDGAIKVVNNVLYQATFINASAMGSDINMLFMACLDGYLRVYNDKLTLKSCMPWQNGQVREMVYNIKKQEIITAGSMGVKVWECELDYEAYRNSKDLNPFDIPRKANGEVVTWCFGKYQHAKCRLSLSLPPDVPAPEKDVWCDKIVFHEQTQTLFLVLQGSVFGYEMSKGEVVMKFCDLHVGLITAMVYMPVQDTMVTSSTDTGATVWRVTGGVAHRFKQLGGSSLILHMSTNSAQTQLLLCASDGSVNLLSTESLLTIYKMKLAGVATHPTFFSRSRFFLHFESDVKVFSVQNLYQGWMDCNSEPLSLQQLSYGLILAEFADSSVRILDSASAATDKSAATTVPQLSMHNLRTACCSLPSGRLFTLLSNSHIHVWEIHLKRPPTFMAAWTHLEKEDCRCMIVLDGKAASEGVTAGLGLTKDNGVTSDHLILGTYTGDCIIASADYGGVAIYRFPAFKHQPLDHLALDLDRAMLVACSRSSIRVYSINYELKCIYKLDAGSQVTRVELLEGRAIIGSASGSILLLDMPTGRTVMSSSSTDHLDRIAGIGASVHLQHCVTSSRDRNVKVFDRDKILKRTIYIAAPVSCCCFLNDEGDILVGLPSKRLVVIRASVYKWVGKMDTEEGKSRASIFDALKGRGIRPSSLIRADTCRLQQLSSAALPDFLAQPLSPQRTVTAARCVSPSSLSRIKARTSPNALLRSNTLTAAIRQQAQGRSESLQPASRRQSLTGRPLPPLPKAINSPTSNHAATGVKALLTAIPSHNALSLTQSTALTMKSSASLLEPLPLPPSLPGPAEDSKHLRGVKLLRLSVSAVADAMRTGSNVLSPIASATQPRHSKSEKKQQVTLKNVKKDSLSTSFGSPAAGAASSGSPAAGADRGYTTRRGPGTPVQIGKDGIVSTSPRGADEGQHEGTDGEGDEGERRRKGEDQKDASTAEEEDGSEESSSGSSSEEEEEDVEGDGVSSPSPVLSRWDQQQRKLFEHRIQELLEAFHTSSLISTRYKMPLPTVDDEKSRQERRMLGVSPQATTTAAPVAAKRPAGHGVPQEGLALASNVQRDATGTYTMHVGDLNIPLENKDLKGHQAALLNSDDPRSLGSPLMSPSLDTLDAEAGQGLDAAFRRALPIIKSMTAFLDEDGLGPELKFKRTKLTKFDPFGKKKKRKKKKEDGIDIAGDDGAEASQKKKKKKKKKRRRRRADLDPATSLAQATDVAAILVELQTYHRHHMITQQLTTTLNPGQPGRAKAYAASNKGTAEAGAGEAVKERDVKLEPPNLEKMLNALKHGWRPGFLEEPDIDVAALVGGNKQEHADGNKKSISSHFRNVGMAALLSVLHEAESSAVQEGVIGGVMKVSDQSTSKQAEELSTPTPNLEGRLVAQVPRDIAAQGMAMVTSEEGGGRLDKLAKTSQSMRSVKHPNTTSHVQHKGMPRSRSPDQGNRSHSRRGSPSGRGSSRRSSHPLAGRRAEIKRKMSMVLSGADPGLHAALSEFSITKTRNTTVNDNKHQVIPIGHTRTTITAEKPL
ncbi:hypothetical protein CEUSTIGMA_g11494.t1 [Chlamydomonas eustigma]|uniref:Uncharacterized protein n=1 Tax=Chlamydomonas eustigma TaxID=1157962 RepID=A0A250XMQ7_9CHLO|nr:hypothetical protein CEUSTIGMA_g11494.t1 [Chlamydomonas eustigma]|eukprot:GAX84070.1 hypothetical protein CEUSTIGMA_g11494.t1 [Chlamydomonas eustigma]